MTFDHEGHIRITPVELSAQLHDTTRIVNKLLLPGTPAVFPTYALYSEFLQLVSDELAVHPACVVLRGSAKVGFSMSPRSAKVWVAMAEDSDLDFAIVDADRFHLIDSEVRAYERTRPWQSEPAEYRKSRKRREMRAFYCYRHLDLPDVDAVSRYKAAMKNVEAHESIGGARTASAFFFRDWWSFLGRYEYDLRQLHGGLRVQHLPEPAESPRERRQLTNADLETYAEPDKTTELCLSEMPGISDAGLPHLARFTRLQSLWLDDLPLTDSGLAGLTPLDHVSRLSLCRTQLADGALSKLASWQRLRRLFVRNTRITDEGLKVLRSLSTLKVLDVRSCNVTSAGVKELKAAVPDLEVLA